MLANGHCREASKLLDLIGNRSAESEIPSESLKSKIEDREQNIAQLGPSISNLKRPWKKFKKSLVHAEVSNMLIALQGLIDLQKSEIVARNVQTLYQRIANDVRSEASRYRNLVDRLEGLAATLLNNAEASNPLMPQVVGLGPLDRIVLPSEVLAEMTTECSNQVPLIVGDLKGQDMTSWVELPENEILDAIVEAVRIRFPQIPTTIEELINQNNMDLEELLSDLKRRSPFALHLDGTHFVNYKSEDVNLLGVPDATNTLFNDLSDSGIGYVTTGDAERITLLRVKYGISINAIPEFKKWATSFSEEVKRGRKPWMLLPDSERGEWDRFLHPVKDDPDSSEPEVEANRPSSSNHKGPDGTVKEQSPQESPAD